MRLGQFKALLALSSTGSIRGAARELNLSQSAVTRALRELEEDVGAKLFERRVDGTRFTPSGQSLLSHARLVMATLDRARDEVRRLNGQGQARVCFALTPLVATLGLHRIVQDFHRRYPDGQLDVDLGMVDHALPLILEGRLDFAVTFGYPDMLTSDMVFRPFAAIRMVPTVGAGAQVTESVTWEDLAERFWALHPGVNSVDQRVMDWLARRGIRPHHPPTLCRSPYLLTVLGGHSDLIMLAPEPMLTQNLEPGGLRRVILRDDQELPPPIQMGLITRRHVPLSEAAQHVASLTERICSVL